MPIEKFSTIKPAPGQGKRVMKSKLLTALGATGVLRPYIANPEHILERKILLQNAFNPNPVAPPTPPPPATNGLLNGLTSYWKMDNFSGVSTPDSIGANTLTLNGAAGTGSVAGKINNGCDLSPGSSYANHVSNSDFAMGAGVSFTFSLWIYSSQFNPGANIEFWLSKLDNGLNNEYALVSFGLAGNILIWEAWDTNNIQKQISMGVPSNSAFHHIAMGFDASSNTLFCQLDNGARLTSATTSNGIISTGVDFRLGEPNGGGFPSLLNMTIDELGLWHRALSTADVSNLYNAGAGLPLSSFQA